LLNAVRSPRRPLAGTILERNPFALSLSKGVRGFVADTASRKACLIGDPEYQTFFVFKSYNYGAFSPWRQRGTRR
jgi:hypothetical protein